MIGISCPGCDSREIDYAVGACPHCRHEIMSCYCRQCGHAFLAALGYEHVSLSESESLGGDEVSL